MLEFIFQAPDFRTQINLFIRDEILQFLNLLLNSTMGFSKSSPAIFNEPTTYATLVNVNCLGKLTPAALLRKAKQRGQVQTDNLVNDGYFCSYRNNGV